MAKKDFDKYVLTLENQYEEYKKVLKEIEKEVQEGKTDIDFYQNFQQQVLPIEQNYKRVLYLKFLLDQPQRKEKLKKYKKQIQKQIKQLGEDNSPSAVFNESKEVLKNIKA